MPITLYGGIYLSSSSVYGLSTSSINYINFGIYSTNHHDTNLLIIFYCFYYFYLLAYIFSKE